MSDDLSVVRFGSRRWIAWKLVQLAHRIFDAEYYERISITTAEGAAVAVLTVVCDGYGAGVMGGHTSGYHKWQWDEITPDWLADDD